jgi:hypothetical protein
VPTIAWKPTGSVHFDARTLSLQGEAVSLCTLAGRIQVPLALGALQSAYLAAGQPKEAERVRRNSQWFLNLVLDLPDAAPVHGGRSGHESDVRGVRTQGTTGETSLLLFVRSPAA